MKKAAAKSTANTKKPAQQATQSKGNEETAKLEATFGNDITRIKEVFFCFDRDMDGKLEVKGKCKLK